MYQQHTNNVLYVNHYCLLCITIYSFQSVNVQGFIQDFRTGGSFVPKVIGHI